jgi:PRTRC genetic system protein C
LRIQDPRFSGLRRTFCFDPLWRQSDALAGRHFAGTPCTNRTAALPDFIIVIITHQQSFGEKIMGTTTLKTSVLPREFVFNGSRIPDPDPQMSVDQVRDLLTPSYPEIATATMTGPEDTGTTLRYSFSRAIGSKG